MGNSDNRKTECAILSANAFLVLALGLLPLFWSIPSGMAQDILKAPIWISLQEVPGGVDLRWFRVQESTSYVVQRRQGQASPFEYVARVQNPVYVDFLASRGITYFYRIVPFDENGREGPPSEERYITLPEDQGGLIQPPEWGVVKMMSEGLALTWDHPDRKSVLAFNIYRRSQAQDSFHLLTSTVDGTFLDRGVRMGETYEYTLTAFDRKLQESDYSQAVKVTYKWSAAVAVSKRPEQSVRTLEEVIRRTELSHFYGWEQYGFVSPVDVEYLPSVQYLYISDSGTGQITVVNSRDEVVQRLGGSGDEPWKFERLMGLTLDSDGTVFAADAFRGQVAIFDARGVYQYRISMLEKLEQYFGPSFLIDHPGFRFGLVDVALGSDGSLFITDNPNAWLYVLDARDNLINVVSEKGEEQGQMHFPTFLALGARGRIFVSDTMNSRLQVFGPTWISQNIIGERGLGIGQFIRPKGIVLDGSGLLFIADSFLNAIQAFTTEGHYVGLLGNDRGLPLDLGLPNGIEFIPPNQLAITEKISRRVQVRRLDMALLRPLVAGGIDTEAEKQSTPEVSVRATLQGRSNLVNELVGKIRLLAESGGTLAIREPLFEPGGAKLLGVAFPLLQQISLLAEDPKLEVRIEVFAMKVSESKGSLPLGQERVRTLAKLLPKEADNLQLYTIVNPLDGVFQDRVDLTVLRLR